MIDIKTSIEVLSYRSPVPVRGQTISKNRFLKVSLLEKDYFLSVLPGFHQASLEEIDFKLKYFFTQYSLNFTNIDLTKPFFNLVALDNFLLTIKDEVLFNIESLLLGMINSTHPQLFKHTAIHLNQLYRPNADLNFYKDSQCLKIKITPQNATETSELINDLLKINSQTTYRLDGNRRFEIDEMISFEALLRRNISEEAFYKIDYIEEPFKNFYDTFLYEKRSQLKVAIDESYKLYMNSFDLNLPAVIKPSLIGISPIFSWLRSHQDKRAIISSSFEHPTVLVSLDFLAQERPEEYHGLENFF